jgi:hypothetical protein
MKIPIIAALWVALTALAPAQEEGRAGDEALAARLSTTTVTFKFLETPVRSALEYLGRQSGVPVFVPPDLGEDVEITFQAQDMPLDRALRWVTFLGELGYRISGNRVVVSERGEIERSQLQLAMFDVRDLVIAPRDEIGRDLVGDVLRSGFDEEVVFEEIEPTSIGEDQLVDIIVTAVDPESWEEDGRTIEIRRSVLIVRQSPETLAKIADLLGHVRSVWSRMIEVSVDVLAVTPAAWQSVLAGGGAAPAARLELDREAADALAARIEKADGIDRIARFSSVCNSSQRISLQATSNVDFVSDYDVEVASGSAAADPIVSRRQVGCQVDLRPTLTYMGKEIVLRMICQAVQPELMDEVSYPGEASEASVIQLPSFSFAEVRTSARIQSGGACILVASDASRGKSPDRVVFVIRAAARSEEGK